MSGAADGHGVEERQRIHHAALNDLADVEAVHGDRQRLRAQAPAFAGRARSGHHERFQIETHPVGAALVVAPLHMGDDAFPRAFRGRLRCGLGGRLGGRTLHGLLDRLAGARRCVTDTMEQLLTDLRGDLPPRFVEIEAELLGEAGENHLPHVAVGLAPRQHHALEDRDARVAQNQIIADRARGAEPTAHLARAEGRVEGKVTRLELRHRNATRRAAVALRKHLRDRLGPVIAHDFSEPFGQPQRGFHGVGDSTTIFRAHHQSINDHRDRVIQPAVELWWIGQFDEFTIDDRAHEALLARTLEQVLELALSLLHQWRADLEARAFRPRQHHLGDLRGALPLHGAPTVGTVRRAGARVQQTQVVVHLGDGADGGARVVTGGFLLDRDGGREPLDGVDIGLLHEPQELSRVRGERLDVASLPFGVDRIERERRFARAGQAGHDRQLVARDRDADVAEIMLAGTAHHERIGRTDRFGHSH